MYGVRVTMKISAVDLILSSDKGCVLYSTNLTWGRSFRESNSTSGTTFFLFLKQRIDRLAISAILYLIFVLQSGGS